MRYNQGTNEVEFDVDYYANANSKIPLNGKLLFTHINYFIRETWDSGNFINYVLLSSRGITTQEHRFFANGETRNEFAMTIDQDEVFFSRERREIVEGQYHLQVDTIDTGENDMTFKRNYVDD